MGNQIPMIFPETTRVIYQKNPLEQVICQLRFPPILKIESSLPAEFQEKIRPHFPLYEDKSNNLGNLPQEIVQNLPSGFTNMMFGGTSRAYDFISEDKSWTISLTKDFIALTNLEYVRWEEFKDKLEIAYEAFVTEYAPASFSRIGLRYRNIIRKNELNLSDENWENLLESYIVGELASPEAEIKNSIVGTLHNVLINLENNSGQVKIVHGLVQDNDTKEPCYLIDSDFFTEVRTDVGDVFRKLTQFNQENHRLFRWCITEKLHQSMQPQIA